VILVVTFWMRRSLTETPVFTDSVAAPAERTDAVAGTIRSTFRDDWRSLLLILGLRFAEALPYFLLTPYIATVLAGPDGARWPLVAGYVMLGALISMFAVWRAPETFRHDLRTTSAAVH